MSRVVTVAATQMACSWDRQANIANADRLVREAAAKGAQIILIQELFETPYFCQKPNPQYLQLATPVEQNPAIQHFQKLAAELQVVLPISFFELAGRARFNSIAIIDADGKLLGVYRKSHIPDGPGYHEKYYFNPGDTGFKVWNTRYARIGVAICWDQWFPETARSMALMGAELLFYPTAIGSEPHDASITSRDHWQRVQQGHAGANLMPLIASNRIGREEQDGYDITFYGSSFIADQFGAKVEEMDETSEGVLVHSFDLDQLEHIRSAWGVPRSPAEPVRLDQDPRRLAAVRVISRPSARKRRTFHRRTSAVERPAAVSTLHGHRHDHPDQHPRQDGYYMPAEWAPHSQTWMVHAAPGQLADNAAPAQAASPPSPRRSPVSSR